jgi:acetoacetyl-CoA synthetase
MQERLQSLLGRPLPLSIVFEASTSQALARFVETGATGHESIVARLRTGDATRAPLFCLFGVALYRDLAEALPRSRDVYALHVPSFPSVRGTDHNVEAAARRYVAAIRRARPQGPYALLGLCYGGIVAFEAARQLAREGETIESVTVLDAILPEAVTIDWQIRLMGQLRRLQDHPTLWLTHLARSVSNKVAAHAPWKAPSPLPGSLWSPPVDGPEADRAIASFANDRTPLDAPVLVVRARKAEQPDWISVTPDLGWAKLAPRLRVLSLDTAHLELLRHPFVDAVAQMLPG